MCDSKGIKEALVMMEFRGRPQLQMFEESNLQKGEVRIFSWLNALMHQNFHNMEHGNGTFNIFQGLGCLRTLTTQNCDNLCLGEFEGKSMNLS